MICKTIRWYLIAILLRHLHPPCGCSPPRSGGSIGTRGELSGGETGLRQPPVRRVVARPHRPDQSPPLFFRYRFPQRHPGFHGLGIHSQENAEAWVNGRKALSYQESLQGDCVSSTPGRQKHRRRIGFSSTPRARSSLVKKPSISSAFTTTARSGLPGSRSMSSCPATSSESPDHRKTIKEQGFSGDNGRWPVRRRSRPMTCFAD